MGSSIGLVFVRSPVMHSMEIYGNGREWHQLWGFFFIGSFMAIGFGTLWNIPSSFNWYRSLISLLHVTWKCLLCVPLALLFLIDKSSLGMSRINEAIPWVDCPYAKSNANTFVRARARAYRVFRPRVSGSTSGAPLGAFSTLRVPPRLTPPYSVGKT